MHDEAYLKQLRENLDPALAAPGPDAVAAMPSFWQGYLHPSEAERRNCLLAEMRELADYLPQTANRMAEIAMDAFLLESPRLGICRFVAVAIEGAIHFQYSRSPLGHAVKALHAPVVDLLRARAPEALTYLYFQMMDGLTDIHDLAGFKNSLALTTVEDEIDTYHELPFHDRLEALGDPARIVELLASGGGGYLLIDLNRDQRGDPDPLGFRMSAEPTDQWSPDRPVPLFAMLDAWMAVGLGQSGPK